MANDWTFYGDLYHPSSRECRERTPSFSMIGVFKGKDTTEGDRTIAGMIHVPAPEVTNKRHRGYLLNATCHLIGS